MRIAEQVQSVIHTLEVGRGARVISLLVILSAFAALGVLYDTRAYHSFNSPEAMDAAQIARNLAEGNGFSTDYIRPFSIYLVQKNQRAAPASAVFSTNVTDFAHLNSPHPDLANAPLYPALLAGWFKAWTPQWKVELRKPFWSEGGNFRRYMPEFRIAILNQLLLFILVLLTFSLARKLFDAQAAWLAALFTLASTTLWSFSVSGQSTLLLLVIFLALTWCLVAVEEQGRAVAPKFSALFLFAIGAGILVGLGMLTRYSFGWLIVPVAIFFALFGGGRRGGLAVASVLTFALAVAPWLARNLAVSGTLFGTAGYAVVEGTFGFPGNRLMQSINPDLTSAYWLTPYGHKLLDNLQSILQGELFRFGGWMSILFFAGLLIGLRQSAARRLRYFILMCLGIFILAEALGRTQLSATTPEMNSENLLVLLTPFVVMFGLAFFLTMINQMHQPSLEARFAVVVVLVVLVWQPLITTLVGKAPTVSYPPYYPPDVQKISRWMQPGEMMMSDIPWAVAWYGERQCVQTTINSQYEFFQLNDYIKPVHALYLSLNTLDGKLFSECLQGGVDSWGNFTLKTVAANQLPDGFPLKNFPLETLLSGLYLTDRTRW